MRLISPVVRRLERAIVLPLPSRQRDAWPWPCKLPDIAEFRRRVYGAPGSVPTPA